ncbi:MAG: protein-L-isoaspartate(D-aspartate) O-methyltransferase [Deltaproteobacteria bacterium]|nr:protein-L-isoaspartate(D-aspartate) O-methyltransferase [Deltaproteobacteria bacterium]
MSEYYRTRERMVNTQLIPRGIRDQRVIDAMRKVPRHIFVEEALAGQAYSDNPLPIGYKQTISQPYIVALMTELLMLKKTDKVLEIGTGSGYQTAILAELADWVYSVERINELVIKARKNLDQLKYYNVAIKLSDGTLGLREEAPFDAIMVTAGSPTIPEPLVEQLKVGGLMVIPVGDEFSQTLYRIIRTEDWYEKEDHGGCRFVKLIGSHGWSY